MCTSVSTSVCAADGRSRRTTPEESQNQGTAQNHQKSVPFEYRDTMHAQNSGRPQSIRHDRILPKARVGSVLPGVAVGPSGAPNSVVRLSPALNAWASSVSTMIHVAYVYSSL